MNKACSALNKALQTVGGGSALARVLGVSPMAVSKWKLYGVPVERVPFVVKATQGQVKAHELRPDLPEIFPPPDPIPQSA